MARELQITGIMIHANATPCAYHCRYCQLHTSKPKPASFARYVALVERFIEWKAHSGREDFALWPWHGNSYEHDLPTLAGMLRLDERLGRHHEVLLLGGVRNRPMAALRPWLEERRALGITTLVATFSGHGQIHDHWNNAKGNYQFQLDALHLAAEMGMKLQQRMLLMRSNVLSLEAVLNDLDQIASTDYERWAIPMFYSGRARRLESERLTEDDFERLSPRVKSILRADSPNWRSERRWIEHAQSRQEAPHGRSLPFRVTEQTLDWAEARSCDAIVEELTARYRAAAERLPSTAELADRHGDRHNDKVYFNLGQMECLWMERHAREFPQEADTVAVWLQ